MTDEVWTDGNYMGLMNTGELVITDGIIFSHIYSPEETNELRQALNDLFAGELEPVEEIA